MYLLEASSPLLTVLTISFFSKCSRFLVLLPLPTRLFALLIVPLDVQPLELVVSDLWSISFLLPQKASQILVLRPLLTDVASPIGNGVRHFPYTGFLGLTPVKIEGCRSCIIHGRFP